MKRNIHLAAAALLVAVASIGTARGQLMADLAITKTDGAPTEVPGTTISYTIVASNAGPDSVTGATVADTFPGNLTCTWTCVGAGGGSCTAAGSGNIGDTVNLPAGGSTTYTATCAIVTSATGSLSNTATVSSAVTDPAPGNNSATDTDTLTPQANLGITKADGVTTAVPGGSISYTIVASNPGPSDAPSSNVADTFPATLTCTWTCVGAGGGICTAAGSGNISDPVNLPAGGSVTYTASCSIAASATGSLANTATVSSGVTDPTPANNSATDTDTLTPQANLGITKTDGVTTATAGGSTTYTIVASNAGPSDAPGSSVADTFPASLACTWTCVAAGGANCFGGPGPGNINQSIGLPAGGSVTYTAICDINASASGSLVNTATVAAGAGVTDPTPANNSASDTNTVTAAPTVEVSGTKTAGGAFTVSSTIVYTIILANSGTGAQADNPGDEFTDVLPATLALVSASATSGTAVANTGTNTVTWNGALGASGGSVTMTISATILASAAGTTASNQGTIASDADVNGSNEATALTDDPGVTGTGNPTVIAVAGQSVLEIPTLSGFGFAALALLLALCARAALRRTRGI
jgi:uncharacterized repeat protein (TIGR01451 family)